MGPYRAKGKYAGLVASVAHQTNSITTRSQSPVNFRAPEINVEMTSDSQELVGSKTELTDDQGVVTLQTIQSYMASCSSDSEAEMENDIVATTSETRVREESKWLVNTGSTFCKLISFSISLGSDGDSEEEPIILTTSEMQ